MTSKDFEIIAKALKDSKPETTNLKIRDIVLRQWNDSVITMADTLSVINRKFDRVAFINMCNGK